MQEMENATELSHKCQECKMIDLAVSPLFTSDDFIQDQIDWFKDGICKKIKNRPNFPVWEECDSQLGDIWKSIAKSLFDTKDGWWAPKNNCKDLHCDWNLPPPKQKVEVHCSSCLTRLILSTDYLTDPGALGDIIYGYQFLGWCAQFGKETEDCLKKVAYTLPRIMEQVKKQPGMVNRIETLCRKDLNCVE